MPNAHDVAITDSHINSLGSIMLFADVVTRVGSRAGIADPTLFYAGGRAGVLGTVTWRQVQSAFGFFPPEIVEPMWARVLEWGDPMEMARLFAEGLADYGREHWDADTASVVNDLGRRVSEIVVPMGHPLFSGWRAMARTGEPNADAALEIMTLRELRGDIHVQDVAGAGIHPLEAEVVVRGLDGVFLHGWQDPLPDPDAHRTAVARATDRTTERMTAIYSNALDVSQWTDFREAVAGLASWRALDTLTVNVETMEDQWIRPNGNGNPHPPN